MEGHRAWFGLASVVLNLWVGNSASTGTWRDPRIPRVSPFQPSTPKGVADFLDNNNAWDVVTLHTHFLANGCSGNSKDSHLSLGGG